MGTWTNNDGLYIKYGPTEVTPHKGGYINTMTDEHVVSFDVVLEDLAVGTTPTILGDNVVIPKGALINRVRVTVLEVTAGTNANLDVGLVRLDRTTEVDYNGLLIAADGWHEAAIGTVEDTYQGGTDHGADLGEVTTVPCLVTAGYETAAFTDGTLRIEVFYIIP